MLREPLFLCLYSPTVSHSCSRSISPSAHELCLYIPCLIRPTTCHLCPYLKGYVSPSPLLFLPFFPLSASPWRSLVTDCDVCNENERQACYWCFDVTDVMGWLKLALSPTLTSPAVNFSFSSTPSKYHARISLSMTLCTRRLRVEPHRHRTSCQSGVIEPTQPPTDVFWLTTIADIALSFTVCVKSCTSRLARFVVLASRIQNFC